MTTKIYQSILLMIGVTIFMLILIEGVLALLHIPEYSTYVEVYRMPHPIWHHAFVPNSSGVLRSEEFVINYTINSIGLRGPELESPKSRYRIVVLGDSFTEGLGVNEPDTIPRKLEGMLRNKGFDVEVVNTGILSSSPILEYVYLKSQGPILQPDLVILDLDLLDAYDDYHYEKLAKQDANGEVIAVPGNGTQRAWRDRVTLFCDYYKFRVCTMAIRSYVKLHNAFGAKIPIIIGDIETDRFFAIRENASKEDTTLHYGRTLSYVKKIRDTATALNSDFVLVNYPQGFQVSEKEFALGRTLWSVTEPKYPVDIFGMVQDFATGNNMIYINTYYKFNGTKEFPLYYAFDGHFTKRGVELMTEGVTEKLLENEYIVKKMKGEAGNLSLPAQRKFSTKIDPRR